MLCLKEIYFYGLLKQLTVEKFIRTLKMILRLYNMALKYVLLHFNKNIDRNVRLKIDIVFEFKVKMSQKKVYFYNLRMLRN